MSLQAQLHVQHDGFSLALQLQVAAGEVVALLGPNGAGKTTVIRTLAGLQRLDGGQIQLDGAAFADAATGQHLPPEHRHIGVVFQEHRLLPHLDAVDNVAFGLQAAGMDTRHARHNAHAWLQRIGLQDKATRRPSALSGGQAQRVALARTLAPSPRLLLLDEPTAALDVDTRRDMRTLMATYLDDHAGPVVLVTHDGAEAAALADRLVIVEAGRITQAGTVEEVTANPVSAWVADLLHARP